MSRTCNCYQTFKISPSRATGTSIQHHEVSQVGSYPLHTISLFLSYPHRITIPILSTPYRYSYPIHTVSLSLSYPHRIPIPILSTPYPYP